MPCARHDADEVTASYSYEIKRTASLLSSFPNRDERKIVVV